MSHLEVFGFSWFIFKNNSASGLASQQFSWRSWTSVRLSRLSVRVPGGVLGGEETLIIIYWVSRRFHKRGFQTEGWASVDLVNCKVPSNTSFWTSFIDCYCHLFLFLFGSTWFKNLYVNSRKIYHGLRCIWNKLSVSLWERKQANILCLNIDGKIWSLWSLAT